jgi:hypothetical protein
MACCFGGGRGFFARLRERHAFWLALLEAAVLRLGLGCCFAVLLLRLPPPFKAREQCVGFLRLDLGMVYKTFSTPRQQNAGMMDAATEARWNAWGSVPRGEAGTLHRDGAPYVAIVCGTEVFPPRGRPLARCGRCCLARALRQSVCEWRVAIGKPDHLARWQWHNGYPGCRTLASSVGSSDVPNDGVRFWPIATIRSDALNGRYRRHSGHWAEMALI